MGKQREAKTPNPLRDLKIKKVNGIAQSEDAVAKWDFRNQMKLTNGLLYVKWLLEGSKRTLTLLVVPQRLRETTLQQNRDSKLSGDHFAFQKTLNWHDEYFHGHTRGSRIAKKCENYLSYHARSSAGKKKIALLQKILKFWDTTQQCGSRYPRISYKEKKHAGPNI